MEVARRKFRAEDLVQSQCKDTRLILKFNTKGVKNFSELTIIKNRKRKTAQMMIEMTTKDETRGNDLSETGVHAHFVDIHQLFG